MPGSSAASTAAGQLVARPGTNQNAIVSLVLGIVGFFAMGLSSPVAVFFGHRSLSQIRKMGEDGHGLAVAGLVLGYLGLLLLALIAGIVLISLFGTMSEG